MKLYKEMGEWKTYEMLKDKPNSDQALFYAHLMGSIVWYLATLLF